MKKILLFTVLLAGMASGAFATVSPTYLGGSFYDKTQNRLHALEISMSTVGGPIPTTFDDLTDGTTNKAYTANEKTKLAGVAAGATANSSDATLLNRANHTGTQAASTITGLAVVATSGVYSDLTGKPSLFSGAYADLTGKPSLATVATSGDYADLTGLQAVLDSKVSLTTYTIGLAGKANVAHTHLISETTGLQAALDLKATVAALTSATARITALENWQAAIKFARAEPFTATTNGSGDTTINTSVAFTSPLIVVSPRMISSTLSEGYHAVVTAVSGTAITVRVFQNVKMGCLLGCNIDPDAPATSTTVNLLVLQSQ